jgi:hypothetical protein
MVQGLRCGHLGLDPQAAEFVDLLPTSPKHEWIADFQTHYILAREDTLRAPSVASPRILVTRRFTRVPLRQVSGRVHGREG